MPHLAHASMEPPAAVGALSRTARPKSGRPCRAPAAAAMMSRRRSASRIDNVTVNVTLLGGGFGRKSKCDFVLEAALLSQGDRRADQGAVDARGRHPARLLPHGSAERIEAGLDKSGKVIAWRHRSVAPTILSTFVAGAEHEAPFELGMGLIDMPFDIANLRCENPEAAAHTRIGWFRSVSNIPHAFAVQIDGRGNRACDRARPEGRAAGADRPAAHRRPGKSVKDLWNYGDPLGQLSDRHRTVARRRRTGRRQRRMGPAAAEGPRPRHRRASQLRHLRRDGRRSRGGRQGQAHDPARRHRDRLRLPTSTRSGSARRSKAPRSWA